MLISRAHFLDASRVADNGGACMRDPKLRADLSIGSVGQMHTKPSLVAVLCAVQISRKRRGLRAFNAEAFHCNSFIRSGPQCYAYSVPGWLDLLIAHLRGKQFGPLGIYLAPPCPPVKDIASEADKQRERGDDLRIANNHVFTIESVSQPWMVEHPLPAGQFCPDLSAPAAGRATYVWRRTA